MSSLAQKGAPILSKEAILTLMIKIKTKTMWTDSLTTILKSFEGMPAGLADVSDDDLHFNRRQSSCTN